MNTLWQDIRFGVRMLRKHPGFTAIAVLTLALGIGANAAIFTLTDGVLLQSLPVRSPDQLVAITWVDPKSGANNSFSYPMYQDLRDRNDVFSGVLARSGAQMNVSSDGRNDRVRGELVSGNYFEVLGVRPWAGRLFTQDDDRTPGAHPVAVLSYNFWERRFGKDRGVIGRTILVNEHPLTVIGVTPPDFYGTDLSSNTDLSVPMMMTPVFNPVPKTRLQSRLHQWITLMARRRDGVSLAQAQASLGVLYHQIRESEAQAMPADTSASDRQDFLALTIQLKEGSQGFQRVQQELRTPLLLLFGATGLVLLILCANLANLVLARDAARDQEISVRLALGAGRFRLLRQWLTEALLLSALGAVAGVLVAWWIKSALIAFLPPDYRTTLDSPLGWRFLLFTGLVSLVVGVALGFAPALRAARSPSAMTLHGESRTFVSGGGLFSLRSGLILVQVALSLPLLIGSALFLTSLKNLRGVDTGFSTNNVLIASINPALNGYTPEKTRAFYNDLLNALRATPGVQAASLASDSPISGSWDQNGLVVEGYKPSEDERVMAQRSIISTEYFRSLGIQLIAGRDFTAQDTTGAPNVAIINERMARHFFGDQNPIGKKIGLDEELDTVIVGVVKDAQYLSLREPPLKHFYQPIMQEPRLFDLTMHIKTVGEPTAVAGLVRGQVQRLDAHLPLYDVKTLGAQIAESLTKERIVTWLCTAFGLLATLLTALGLYGVLAFSVAQRTREIGIRVALGAQARDVFKLIIGQGMLLVTAGVVLGVFASYALTKLIASLLFGVAPTNAVTFIAVSAAFGLVALVACYLPARRATKVDPLVALRYE
jgi:predicted permease